MLTLRSATLFILLTLAFNTFSQVDPNFHIYIAFGQSNMQGKGTSSYDNDPTDPNYPTQRDRSGYDYGAANSATPGNDGEYRHFISASNNFKGHALGAEAAGYAPLAHGSMNNAFGPTDFFARKMATDLSGQGIKIGVIVVALGSCEMNTFSSDPVLRNAALNNKSLAKQISDNWYGGNPYQAILDAADAANDVGVIKGFLLHQGESDLNNTWGGKVQSVITDLRNTLNVPNAPLIAGQVRNYSAWWNTWNTTLQTRILDPQHADYIPNSAIIDCSNLPGRAGDDIHFSDQSLEEMGYMYADQMISMLGLGGGPVCDANLEINLSAQNGVEVCQPVTIDITSAINTSYTYTWTGGGTTVGTSLQVDQAGQYTVEATKTGCTTVSTDITVAACSQQCPLNSISLNQNNNVELCESNLDITVDNPGVGYTYTWTGGGTPMGSYSLQVDQTGTYTVTASKSGCTDISEPITVASCPCPHTNLGLAVDQGSYTELCTTSFTISVTPLSGYTYNWSDNTTGTSTSISQTGTYTVTASKSGCADEDGTITFGNCTSNQCLFSTDFLTPMDPIDSYHLPSEYSISEDNNVGLYEITPEANYNVHSWIVLNTPTVDFGQSTNNPTIKIRARAVPDAELHIALKDDQSVMSDKGYLSLTSDYQEFTLDFSGKWSPVWSQSTADSTAINGIILLPNLGWNGSITVPYDGTVYVDWVTFGDCQDPIGTNVITSVNGDHDNLGASYFPNPVEDILTITNSNESTWTMTTLSGRVVESNNTPSIDMSDMASGMYLLHLHGQAFKILKK